MAVSQRIIDNLREKRQDYQDSIAYKRKVVSEILKELTGVQSEIEDLEGKIKENDEAVQKLLKE